MSTVYRDLSPYKVGSLYPITFGSFQNSWGSSNPFVINHHIKSFRTGGAEVTDKDFTSRQFSNKPRGGTEAQDVPSSKWKFTNKINSLSAFPSFDFRCNYSTTVRV